MPDHITHTGRIDLSGLSREEFIVLAQSAISQLKWRNGTVHPLRVEARTRMTAWSFGEDIRIDIGEQEALVSSKHERWSFGAEKRDARNVQRFLGAFAQVKASFSSETMHAALTELGASGVMDQEAAALVEPPSSRKDALVFFIPRPGFFATPLLIDASILVYILMVVNGVPFMEPSSEDLLAWGGNLRSYTLGGQWWRLLTCCFEHIGAIHLLMNMYALAMVGVFLEPLLGRWRLLLLYMVTGVCASLASLWWHENTISAGASGAIFGLYGVLLALLLTDLLHKEVRNNLLSSMGIFILYNLMYGMKGGVDNSAHIGGLVSGLVIGASVYLALRKPERSALDWATVAVPSVVLLGAGLFLVHDLPADDLKFYERMRTFETLEGTGLSALRLPAGATGTDQLRLVQDSSLPAWRDAVELLHGTSDLRISANATERRDLLVAYADERLKSMELLETILQHEDSAMGLELKASFDRTDSLLKLLNAE